MSAIKKCDVLKKATELESKLKGRMFIGGDKPTADDVKAFHELLGTDNVHLYRYLKHIASFTDKERAAFPAGKAAPAKPAKKEEKKPAAKKEEEDDMDLFGEETEEDKAAIEAKKKADAEKKATKKVVIAKSSILLDIKPWEDTTDLEALAKKIKALERDGILWGAHKLVPVAFGLKKLQLLFVIEDDKVSGEDLEDIICGGFEDDVQSMDIVAWNKI